MTTDRLLLEALSEQDNHFIQKIIENPDVNYWVVKLKKENSSIGVVTLIKREYLEHHDIGFAFIPHYMKQGYAFEAANEVLCHLIRDSNHTHIQATTLPSNKNSIKLLERLGLRFEKEIEINSQKLQVYIASVNRIKESD